MRTLVQTCTRELHYFIGPSETVYVLAGNYHQYTSWVMERPGLKTCYIHGTDRLHGNYQFPLVVRVGSWEDRHDICEVKSRLFEMGADFVEFPPGQYVQYSEWVNRQP